MRVGTLPHVSAADFVPEGVGLDGLRAAAESCRGCDLYRNATQTVFSKGPVSARLVLVGEQPGDVEDRRGEPFVGPAGKLLDRAIADAGLDPAQTYTTNAVKHFKFTEAPSGKRRIHATPDSAEIGACRPWLVAEFAVLDPEVVVALGATAAKALFGPSFRVTKSRGVLLPWPDSAAEPADFTRDDEAAHGSAFAVATIHPSAVLRAHNRDEAYAGLVSDLGVAARALAG
ncbi:MAG TPA: UdgX family uracil-DNA binding protein [Mycobacteriales bacterium]|nr:UdgX family uracil-DNA binding protein [Mycobacteriales bacterium]